MDAVEFPIPVAISVPAKIMGSEGLEGSRVTVKEVDDGCDQRRVAILVKSSIERCTTSMKQKDVRTSGKNLKLASWHKIQETELCRPPHQIAIIDGAESSEQPNVRGTDYILLNCRSNTAQSQRKAGKVSRSSNVQSKRLKVAHVEGTVYLAGGDDMKDSSTKQELNHVKSNYPDKTQLVKQKNNSTGKRGDKRNFKTPLKTASFNTAAGGSNLFGSYGLKSDINDITELVDDLSLNGLLDGTYHCPILSKEKEKKVENRNDIFLGSIRDVCSIISLRKPVQSQSFSEADSSSCKKNYQFGTSSVPMVTSDDNSDKGDSCTLDLSPSDKDCCNKPESPANLLDFPLSQPMDVLERLALPPPKDLDTLLQDAAKPSQYSRNVSDVRSGKQIGRRVSLPPFPWSHAFGGHCRNNSDTVKLPTNKSTCQGRWARMGSSASSLETVIDSFTNLESLTYDPGLIPSGGPKVDILDAKTSLSLPGSSAWCESASSVVATINKASDIPVDPQVEMKDKEKAGHPLKLLAAARTLYHMANQSSVQNPDVNFKWPKKPSQKVMKARKLKLVEKPEEVFATSSSGPGSGNQSRRGTEEEIPSSKRPKVSTSENKKDLNDHHNHVKKGSILWGSPRSSRSSIFLVKDSMTERRHPTTSTIKQSCMMPPPARVSEKACSSQQKGTKTNALLGSK